MSQKTGVIYQIRHKETGKSYIGQSTRLRNRLSHHRSRNRNDYFANAIKKYGWNAFEVIILHKNVSIQDLDWLERHSIWIFNTLAPNGYNLKQGGITLDVLKKYIESQKGI